MKYLFLCGAIAMLAACASLYLSGPAEPQGHNDDNICLGMNCPTDGLFNSMIPEIGSSRDDWMRYGEFVGIVGGIEAHRERKNFKACLQHCADHAKESEESCKDNRPYEGFGVCNDLWKKTYESCIAHCQTLPH